VLQLGLIGALAGCLAITVVFMTVRSSSSYT
jgi:hypothetical protein